VTSEISDQERPVEDYYSPEEVREGLEALSTADWARIQLAGRHFAARSDMAGDDIVQEACLRVLTTRRCLKRFTVVEFVLGTMRSVASEELRSRAQRRASGQGGAVPETEKIVVDPLGDTVFVATDLSPEDQALSNVFLSRALQQVARCYEGDDQLELLAEGLFDGLRGKELEELLGVDTKGLAAIKRRLARRITAKFPDGGPV